LNDVVDNIWIEQGIGEISGSNRGDCEKEWVFFPRVFDYE
jgi:hypothetical protein